MASCGSITTLAWFSVLLVSGHYMILSLGERKSKKKSFMLLKYCSMKTNLEKLSLCSWLSLLKTKDSCDHYIYVLLLGKLSWKHQLWRPSSSAVEFFITRICICNQKIVWKHSVCLIDFWHFHESSHIQTVLFLLYYYN